MTRSLPSTGGALCTAVVSVPLLFATSLAAQAPTPIPLNYNFNGIVHAGEAGAPDAPNGFRSISDRALDFTAGIPVDPLLVDFQLVGAAGALDIVHLGNRNTVDNGNWAFDPAPDGDMIGTQPMWLSNPDQSGPQVTTLATPLVVPFGGALSLLFNISNGGGTFEVEVSFASGSSVVGVIEGPDWFNGPFLGTNMNDTGNPGEPLFINLGVVDLSGSVGEVITQIAFQNPSNPIAGYAILAANLGQPGRASPGRVACPFEPFSYQLVPTAPGYVLTVGGTTFDANFAAGSVVSTADDAVVGGNALSFPFQLPGGASVNAIAVDTNGRLLEDVGEFADPTPSIAELLGDASSICPLWTDLNPADPDARGNLWFHDDGTGTSASVTWDRIPQFVGGPGNLNTFQVRLTSANTIEFIYEELNVNVDTTSPDDVIIGVSAGNGAADPEGESSLTAGTIVSTDDVVYEFFDQPAEVFPFSGAPNDTVELIVVSEPILGSNFDVDVGDSTGTATTAIYLFGFRASIFAPPIDLGTIFPLLSGCSLLTDLATPGALFASPSSAPGTPVTITSIPVVPALVGIPGLGITALVINPGLTPAIFPTDERIVIFGF